MAALELTVTHEQSGRTVKSLLKYEMHLSVSLTNRLKRTENGLSVNGSRVFTNAVLREGDRLRVELDAAEEPSGLEPVPMDLDIVCEDEYFLVINKPAPLASIPSSLAPDEPSAAAGLQYYLGRGASIHLVNRLDRGTTGLMAAAKNAYIHDRFRQMLHTDGFLRTYLAICTGVPDPARGRIDYPIGRAPGSAIRRQVMPDGKDAVTEYRTLSQAGDFSLIELTPRTGRTHQLRVHMASIGHPLAGDWLYGAEDRSLIPRPALHAAKLTLAHPVTGEPLCLEAPLPRDMQTILDRAGEQA